MKPDAEQPAANAVKRLSPCCGVFIREESKLEFAWSREVWMFRWQQGGVLETKGKEKIVMGPEGYTRAEEIEITDVGN